MSHHLPATAPPLHAEINLAALRHNFALAKSCSKAATVAVIKADAYGHGALPCAKALADADAMALARLDEALALRAAGVKNRLLVMSDSPSVEALHCYAEQGVDLVLHEASVLARLLATTLTQPIRVWLKVDTGMHRLGFAPQEVAGIVAQLQASANVADIILMSHFAEAEVTGSPLRQQQLAQFETVVAGSGLAASLANTAALLTLEASHFDWVRPGIMLYGADPLVESNTLSRQLQPVMRLNAPVIATRIVPAGETVGYGASWRAQRDSLIATIGVGYGDGYPRHAVNGTPVYLNGQRVPLAGRVSMDSITVDATDLPALQVGDQAQLWGDQVSVNEVAQAAGTIAYELLTGLSPRVPRCYREA